MKPDFKKYINDRDYNDWTAMVDIINQFAEDYAEQERKKAVYETLYETLDLVERYGIEKIKNDVYNADTKPKIQR